MSTIPVSSLYQLLQCLYLTTCSGRLPSLDKEGQGWLDPVAPKPIPEGNMLLCHSDNSRNLPTAAHRWCERSGNLR